MLFDVYEDFYRETDIVTNMCGHATNLSESILFQVRLGLIEEFSFPKPGSYFGSYSYTSTYVLCMLALLRIH
jgi:hypothetical protein